MGLFDGTPLEQVIACSRCELNIKQCTCPQMAEDDFVDPAKQRLRVALEKRRRGKLVTLIAGFEGSSAQLQSLLSELKQACGTGGSIAGKVLELQGDLQARVSTLLSEKGYPVGRSRQP